MLPGDSGLPGVPGSVDGNIRNVPSLPGVTGHQPVLAYPTTKASVSVRP